ncbi:mitochondrial inner membrane protease subunit 1-like [Chenopodium quinoa]|uniref:mitochondrial inner membrane protease subunit 1-like n=1 Tax=Chenopodium quinoa TaxID=63459 RepID=UPI000B7812D8|nr:mitochondrial inner membrane protease subunit 1-like [Chenopodium quinoa]
MLIREMKWNNFWIPSKYLYFRTKLVYTAALSTKKRLAGGISDDDTLANWCKDFIQRKMTYVYRSEGQEMAPTIPGRHETLLIRNLPCPNLKFRLVYRQVSVGDVVLLKNPLDSDRALVRRLAALGGHQMVSTDEKDEPFVIRIDHCWVLADNKELKAREANDSRTFGPVPAMDIIGRVIYRFQSMEDHGRVENSNCHLEEDAAVVKFELELDEMQKFSEA